ncbi:hypothetical protein BRD56_04880 [Thermoplasmatales archaeon SW_10_69_26]|nr:MAG: hypothetical protein BRD56_04880 [Thermoplasmatales archaeon SW_10_69_26]
MLIASVLPTALGRHFSVGTRDSVGTEAVETPNEKSVTDANHATGVSEECYEPDGNLTQDQAQRSLETDPFCGKLIYQSNFPELEHSSSRDQDLRSTSELTIGQFDVIATSVIDEDEEPCAPFCRDQPAETGNLTWQAVHEFGSDAGLTEDPDSADEQNEGPRDQFYGASIHIPKASYVLQQNTDAWRMNGWWSPDVTHNYVAYLYDSEGNPIGDDDLQQDVPKLQEKSELSDAAEPRVCGWSEDFEFTSLNFEGANCEILFEYREPGNRAPEDSDYDEGYNDPCKSPTWVCGGFSGGAWYSQAYCLNCQASQVTGPSEGTFQFIEWHWLVAPAPSDCGGTVQPGVAFETDAENPYLAHDLDVWTQPTDLKSSGTARSTANAEDFAWDSANAEADRAVEGVVDQLPTIPSGPDNPVNNATDVEVPSQVSKADRVEPNADPVAGLGDTSQSLPESGGTLDRNLENACQNLNSNEEPDTVDPWVDLVDGEVDSPSEQGSDSVALYANGDETQDNENKPGPNLFRTEGNVGLFTDKNDDGDYDTLSGNPTVLSTRSPASLSSDKYDDNNIKTTGAYPMLWDVWLTENDNGQTVVDETGGCQLSDTVTISGEAKAAGYGPNTGLFQVVYLNEPTTVVRSDTGETRSYPGGDNIYLFMSQSARQQYNPDDSSANALDTAIEDAIRALRLDMADDAEIQIPGEDLGLDSDYFGQCSEDTGGFTLEFSFTHDCSLDCSGDTIVTGYTFEVERLDGTLGGRDASSIPLFEVDNQAYDFGQGAQTWTDVDPFDNNPDRQDDEDDSPPT